MRGVSGGLGGRGRKGRGVSGGLVGGGRSERKGGVLVVV